MKEPDREDLASHAGPESDAPALASRGEALTGESAGELWSREIIEVRGAAAILGSGRQYALSREGGRQWRRARSQNLSLHGHASRENQGISWPPTRHGATGRGGKSQDACP